MSFQEALAMHRTSRTAGGTCSVLKWRETLTELDLKQFDAADADESIPHSVIHRAMKDLGYELSTSAVQRHRTGGCKCPSMTS